MDNPYYLWSPIVRRPILRWPGDAALALCIVISVEHVEWHPPNQVFVPGSAVRVGPYPKVPDIHETSLHEYGPRVGMFRLIDVLDHTQIPATVAIDAFAVENYPDIVQGCRQRGFEFVGHGLSGSRMITQLMDEREERTYIDGSLAAITKATGIQPKGWIGIDYGESTRTVRLLAESGVRYVCDWPNDEQPYHMIVPAGQMVSLPVAIQLDEYYSQFRRSIPMAAYATMVTDTIDRLVQDGRQNGRVLVMNLHPWLIGQPHRIAYLRDVLQDALYRHRQDIWTATGSDIVAAFLDQNPPPK